MSYTSILKLEDYNSEIFHQFDIEAFSFNIEQTLNIGSQTTGSGAGKVTFNPFSVTRVPDLMSPILMLHCCSGTPFKTVTLTIMPAGSDVAVATYELGLAAIKMIDTTGNQHGGNLPVETVTFEYGYLQITVHDIATGKSETDSWNRVKNIKGFLP